MKNIHDLEKALYYYRAVVVSVYDADTITVNMDLGLKTWVMEEKIRLSHINAPEVRGEERPEGLKARDALRELLPGGSNIFIATQKDSKGKFGRYLGEVWIEKGETLISVNDWLVENGFAEYKEY